MTINTELIKTVQHFLAGHGYTLDVDGRWGIRSEVVMKAWQRANKLSLTGVIDTATLASMKLKDLPPVTPTSTMAGQTRINLHYPPALIEKLPDKSFEQTFGSLKPYSVNWSNSDHTININPKYRANLIGFSLKPYFGLSLTKDSVLNFLVFQSFAPTLDAALRMAEALGVLGQVTSCAGGFYPRLQRGSNSAVSTHSYGTTFDVNAPQNPMGRVAAQRGKPGCLFDFAMVMQAYGIYWGGWFQRIDAMHFEATSSESRLEPMQAVVRHEKYQEWADAYFPNKEWRNLMWK